ncbi:HAD family hydrolase [Sphaerospermopsis sp. FACHB-1094]|uniref:HAD family hydrolase n=1 Tax=Sphaerospermopsis sp. FACHB-1094 TaxID=2692861 RepID=UPI00168889C3|nr:HAD hydrolase-like protein [Sphaerospermopsis sp. FACHB-1094]MBD2130972.1 HAD family hydrolase [Sphaerospermopsis sp. FACHB-1094]
MTVKHPAILALDFDGVICDGLIEYFEVAWRTYCQIWSSSKKTSSENLAQRFYRLRPVIETGWEMPVLIKALINGFTDEEILQDWLKITPAILTADHLEAKEIMKKLDGLRDEWIATDLEGWLSLHKFYPGVIERLKLTLASGVQLFIVTTKEGRFVKQLLQQEGVNLPDTAIFGKEVKRPKYETLRELISQEKINYENLWFVEDRLKTLELVKQQSDLKDVQLFLADWGYNTQPEREAGQNDSRIRVISLSDFSQDFSHW